jgi:putative ABC transport system permease protein
MFANYLKIAWRNLLKNRTFSVINIFGLSIGLTCCLLIALYLNYELGYDRQHPDASRIYQVGTTFVKGGKDNSMPNTPYLMGKTMQLEFPEVEESVRLLRLFGEDKTLLRYTPTDEPTVAFYENKGFLTDSGYFRFFQYQFIAGNPATALNEPNTIVLSEEIANKMFGNQPALNKIVHVSSSTNGETNARVTGVFRAGKHPSHIDGRFFMSLKGGDMERYSSSSANLVYNNMYYTYLKLKPGADPVRLAAKFPAFVEKYAGNELRAAGFYKKQYLTALTDIHLRSGSSDNVTPSGSITYLYILGSIALFALLIACINFMNLSTARSAKRSTEVGIRKVLGANKSSLIWQFLGESILLSMIAFVVAVFLTWLCLPAFSKASGKELYISISEHGLILAGFFALSLVTGIVAGLYPAFYLSSFKPVRILKSKFSNSFAAVSLRKGLVVFQFTIAAVLIISSVVIGKQMRYMRSQDLGFAKDQQLIIPLRSASAKKMYTPFTERISKVSQVVSVGGSTYYPGIFNPSDASIFRKGAPIEESKVLRINTVDENFIKTIGIKLIAGRLFSKEFPADTARGLVINETAVRELGFSNPQAALGRTIRPVSRPDYDFDVIGVVKDFHFEDLHLPITPFGFGLNNNTSFNYLLVHLSTNQVGPVLAQLKTAWHELNPNEPFEYSFLDEQFQKNYEAQDRLASIVSFFTIIAILISCLGLFGLAAFSAEQRTKEIGIRKVLGASVSNLVLLMSKDFIRLVLVSIVLASPLAWWIMNKWLQDFAYRTNIGLAVFFISGSIACLIAFLTVSTQALRAALSNPVESLRTE